MRQTVLAWAVGLVCAGMLAVTMGHLSGMVPVGTPYTRPCVVVDAGHGGMDGGAVAPDGTEEKMLNLQLSEELTHLLRLYGFAVTVTRQTDESLDRQDGASIRENKVRDMNARLALYERADFTVSLHQNMFGSASCQGTQVFYSENNPLSKRLGNCIREEIVSRLQPQNERALKAGGKEIYLLYKTTRPTVLVEGGFLSNTDDLARLKAEEPRRQLAFAIACGVVRYTNPDKGAEGI